MSSVEHHRVIRAHPDMVRVEADEEGAVLHLGPGVEVLLDGSSESMGYLAELVAALPVARAVMHRPPSTAPAAADRAAVPDRFSPEATLLGVGREVPEAALCGRRRPGWETPGPGRHRLPCVRTAGHVGDHADAYRRTWDPAPAEAAPSSPRPVPPAPEIGSYGAIEAARILGVHISTLRAWIKSGRLPGHQDSGGKWHIPAEAVHAHKPDRGRAS